MDTHGVGSKHTRAWGGIGSVRGKWGMCIVLLVNCHVNRYR